MSISRASTPIRNIAPGTFPIILAQFEQTHGSDHWTLGAVESTERIYTFEIRGNKDSYAYIYDLMKNLDRVESYRGGCYVGNVPKNKIEDMRIKLSEVIINKQEPRWNPQVWVLDAIEILKEEGWAFEGMTEVFTRRELQKGMLRWDLVEDTVYERVLHELETGRPVSPAPVVLASEDSNPPLSCS